jgi:hypothetical protein
MITKEDAMRLIRITIFEFNRDVMIPLNNNIHLYDRERNADALRLHEDFNSFFAFAYNLYEDGSEASAELAELDDFSLSQLLSLCRDISVLYKLPVSESMPESIPEDSPIRYVSPDATGFSDNLNGKGKSSAGNTVRKIMEQTGRFGDEKISKRLSDIENGNSSITFETMDEYTEGYTKYQDGRIKYCLNKKYQKITSQEDLWRASIILAHELQRDPATGDLRGETAEIVQKDVKFIEQLANEHGDRVYDLNPDFLVMHYVREMFGDEGVRAFADIAFSHEGNYWKMDWRSTSPRSVRVREGRYIFKPDLSTLDGIVEQAIGLVPKVGWALSFVPDVVNSIMGIRRIDRQAAFLRYTDYVSRLAGGFAHTRDIANWRMIQGNLGRFMRGAGRIAGGVSTIGTVINTISARNRANEIGMDLMIHKLTRGEMVASSHEDLAVLYIHALVRVTEWVENGRISFRVDRAGRLTSASHFPADRRQLRSEIRSLREEIERERGATQ